MTARLRVLRVIGRMNVGGPARQVAVLVRQLDPDRFEQRLLIGSVGPGEMDDLILRDDDLPHRRVVGLQRAPRPGDDLRTLAALTDEIRRFQPHVIHTHTAKAGALGRAAAIGLGWAGLPRAALVHTFHGHLLHGYFSPMLTRTVVRMERALARRTDRLVAVGSKVRDDLVEAGIGSAERWSVVPPGVDLGPVPEKETARRALGIPPDVPVVAYVTRLTAVKRPDRFAELAARLGRAHPDAIFVVAGWGELGDDLRRRLARAGLGQRARLLGWRADVETVYGAADVLVLTSDNEGMPLSLIEGALAGRPAVTTAVGSAGEVVIDGTTGFVVPSTGTLDLSSAVGRLIEDAHLRDSMGAAAALWARPRFSSARLVDDTERLYEDLAHEREWWKQRQSRQDSARPPQ